MRRISTFLLMAIMLFSLSACGNSNQNSESTQSEPERAQQSTEEQAENTQPDGSETKPEQAAAGNALVIYFSCTGNTEAVAKEIASQTGAELIQIMPDEPYTEEDINYRNDDCRANKGLMPVGLALNIPKQLIIPSGRSRTGYTTLLSKMWSSFHG